jgi:hypothetical protein
MHGDFGYCDMDFLAGKGEVTGGRKVAVASKDRSFESANLDALFEECFGLAHQL